ncbi:dihydroneopterin aldolase [Pseudohoeflea coraliihabitans]|uniref:7,8-dihydroneopterin aldolase n=1 Tax=Pseudohoeflea coraliihabitans TaxID=2860393 RepID=A0ABS6WQ26_9HYPH|nr:dihydroneopterin aldolase [Pseudohoeflea sp. DP4N28-3]MBW3098063.1 dihydroneopterin aldolase [Pseudohoeflea sp. DP4N28-3]
MSETYVIKLVNCAFFARHGLYEAEEKLGQRFFVDAELTVRSERPLIEDDVDSTVDYGAVFKVVEKTVTGERRALIEALARDIGLAVLREFPPVQTAEITIRKPNVPIAGILDHAEVTVVSERTGG